MTERNATIDFLRGFAMLVMVVIHVSAFYLSDKTTYLIWDYAHFVVPIFTFCSAYLYFEKKSVAPFNFSYIFKRIKRLLVPYYIYLLVYFLYLLISKNQPLNFTSVLKQVLLFGGRDLNWLVVLFLYYLLLLPFIRFLSRKSIYLWIFTSISFLSTVLLLFTKFPYHFRLIMWLPWSTVLLFTYFLVTLKNKMRFLTISAISWILIYFIGIYLLLGQDKTLVFTENKYPPNIYYLAYGMFWITVLYVFHNLLSKFIKPMQPFFDFMSRYSYSLFFIHFFYLSVVIGTFNYKAIPWWLLSIVLLIVSLITQLGINYLLKFKKPTFAQR